ncbi:MAG: putative sulfate exporter family transporter, partial [Deltaproteobacteria bacterium]|nr:putative sulfate exporter family transporter [Deltaproteobacteria bacterium]
MAKQAGKISELYKTEDCWAIWLGLLIIFVAMAFFWSGTTIKGIAITPGKWSDLAGLWSDLVKHFVPYIIIFLGFGLVFTISMAVMGHNIKE